MVKRILWLIVIVLSVQLSLPSSAQSAPQSPSQIKELNFVFLHGAWGNACDFQLLSDSIIEQLPGYIITYEKDHPETRIRFNTLNRCYPNNVDINTWASNIADSINKNFQNKQNLILIGHSMGGKAALYAVAQNLGGLADKVAMVETINSPIKSLQNYYFVSGGSILDYWTTRLALTDRGMARSLAYYDSSKDGSWVGSNKHWLAFISGEASPNSNQFDTGGIDPLPRDMDDSIIPISAQYSEGADVIYYGEHAHSDFTVLDEVAGFIADQILRYVFGGYLECSVFARGGVFEHKAGWMPTTNRWEDVVGEVLAGAGRISHVNDSYIKWQEWEDVVGENITESSRSSYHVSQVNSFPFFTGVSELRWLSADKPEDCRLYIKTRAAPRSSVQVDWSINGQGLLPVGIKRDRYEVEIVTGTPSTGIEEVSWVTDDPYDLMLRISSEAEGPFRWFKAEWRAYRKETRVREVIDEIPAQVLSETAPSSR